MYASAKYICPGQMMGAMALHGSRAPGIFPALTNASVVRRKTTKNARVRNLIEGVTVQ